MPRPLPAPQEDFIGLAGTVNLATGGEPPLLVAHRAAFERFAADKAGGFDGYHRHWQVIAGLRARLGRWMGLAPEGIALVANASEAIMRVVSSVDWRAGDNVVVPELDYSSGRFALASLKRRGVELRLVPAAGWRLETGALLDRVDARTRLIYVSQVNALTGQHADIAAISAGLGGGDTALMVDASHALGAVPVRGELADFTISCSYKFALGIHEGILGWNRARRPDFAPLGAGWASATQADGPGDYAVKEDARRAEYGNPGHLGAYLLVESLDYLDGFGIAAIAAHLRGLSGRLVEGMAALGLEVLTPAAAHERAGSAAFACADPAEVVRRAAVDRILVWGDNGRVRASAHLFTQPRDVESFLGHLPGYVAGIDLRAAH